LDRYRRTPKQTEGKAALVVAVVAVVVVVMTVVAAAAMVAAMVALVGTVAVGAVMAVMAVVAAAAAAVAALRGIVMAVQWAMLSQLIKMRERLRPPHLPPALKVGSNSHSVRRWPPWQRKGRSGRQNRLAVRVAVG
jgi:hypothetical protein